MAIGARPSFFISSLCTARCPSLQRKPVNRLRSRPLTLILVKLELVIRLPYRKTLCRCGPVAHWTMVRSDIHICEERAVPELWHLLHTRASGAGRQSIAAIWANANALILQVDQFKASQIHGRWPVPDMTEKKLQRRKSRPGFIHRSPSLEISFCGPPNYI